MQKRRFSRLFCVFTFYLTLRFENVSETVVVATLNETRHCGITDKSVFSHLCFDIAHRALAVGSFAAGAMIYVVTEELIPESQNGKHSNIGTIGVAIGFTLMMVLDVALG